jgi:antitoxin MazE
MRTKIVKWGNSLGLRIPKAFAEEVRVGEGSVVDISMEDGNLVVKVTQPEGECLEELLEGVTEENLHGEFDSGDPVGGEVW